MYLLREKQLEMLKLIKKIDGICKENNIKYCLAYGTTLGAIRHKGFIPWDDDADIHMSIEDYKKFESIWHKRYSDDEEFFLQNYKTDKKYPMLLPKIRNRQIDIKEKYFESMDIQEGIWIDIFVVAHLSNNRLKRKFQESCIKLANFLNHKYFYLSGNEFVNKHHNRVKLKAFMLRLTPDILLKPIKRVLIRASYTKKHTNYVKDIMEDIYLKEDYTKEIIYTQFENKELPVPKKYDRYLTEIYGDYMTPIKYTHDFID